jgi:hypothetical protein
MTTALHHKILANYHGRLADHFSDNGNPEAAANHYQQEAYHIEQREAHGGHLGGRQLSFAAATAYAAKYAA